MGWQAQYVNVIASMTLKTKSYQIVTHDTQIMWLDANYELCIYNYSISCLIIEKTHFIKYTLEK